MVLRVKKSKITTQSCQYESAVYADQLRSIVLNTKKENFLEEVFFGDELLNDLSICERIENTPTGLRGTL